MMSTFVKSHNVFFCAHICTPVMVSAMTTRVHSLSKQNLPRTPSRPEPDNDHNCLDDNISYTESV